MESFRLTVEELCKGPVSSLARVALQGTNDIIVNHASDMIYYVESGHGVMMVGNRLHYLSQGESVTIFKGMPYQDQSEGNDPLVMLAYASPAFDPQAVEAI